MRVRPEFVLKVVAGLAIAYTLANVALYIKLGRIPG